MWANMLLALAAYLVGGPAVVSSMFPVKFWLTGPEGILRVMSEACAFGQLLLNRTSKCGQASLVGFSMILWTCCACIENRVMMLVHVTCK
jgi:hypothetical protein